MQTYYSFQKLNWMIYFHQEFKICGFSMPYRYDRNSMGGGLLLYIRDDIPTKLLIHDFRTNIENCQLKLIYEKENSFSMALTIRIKVKF